MYFYLFFPGNLVLVRVTYTRRYIFGAEMVKELKYLTPIEFKCFVCNHKYEKEVIFIHNIYCDGGKNKFSLKEPFFNENNSLKNSNNQDLLLKNYVPVLGFGVNIFFIFFFFF